MEQAAETVKAAPGARDLALRRLLFESAKSTMPNRHVATGQRRSFSLALSNESEAQSPPSSGPV